MADWLDNSAIVQRTRNRILGHVNDVPYAPFNLVTDSTWVHRLPVKKRDRPNRGEGFFREVRRSTIDFAGPANEIIGVGARGEYCGSGHDKKGKRASLEN
jgi:hypothetical protein